MKRVVLVNGVPASGKTTIAREVTAGLLRDGIAAVPLGLDTVKEALYAHFGTGDRDHNRRLGRACYQAIFETIAQFPTELVAVVDAWHGFQPPEILEAHLARAEVGRMVEIWVRVAPATAAARYRARSASRHPGHPPASYAEELLDLAGRARPTGLGPVIEADGERPFDRGTGRRLRAALAMNGTE